MPARGFSPSSARSFYDRFGRKQDSQGFYEDAALARMVAVSSFDTARAVFEFGCGTGRLAALLFERHLPADARYVAVDISATMVRLARARLAGVASRCLVVEAGDILRLPVRDSAADRFVSTYVLDILSPPETRQLIAEAARVVRAGGLLSLVSIARGPTPLSRLVMAVWQGVHRLSPRLVGGCRPIDVATFLSPASWRVVHRSVVVGYGVASEIVVASRFGPNA